MRRRATSADCDTGGDLAPSAEAPGDLQVADVGTREHEDEAQRRDDHRQRIEIVSAWHVGIGRPEHRHEAAFPLPVHRESFVKHLNFLSRAAPIHAVRQTGNHADAAVRRGRTVEADGGHDIGRRHRGKGQPDIDRPVQTVERRVEHANDGEDRLVYGHGLADHFGIGVQIGSPEPIADDGRHSPHTGLIILGDEARS
jgi:hypothetical protein